VIPLQAKSGCLYLLTHSLLRSCSKEGAIPIYSKKEPVLTITNSNLFQRKPMPTTAHGCTPHDKHLQLLAQALFGTSLVFAAVGTGSV